MLTITTAGQYDAYKPDHRSSRWDIKINAFIDQVSALYTYAYDTLGTAVTSLSTLVTNWATTENYLIYCTATPTYVDGDTFTVPGDLTASFPTGRVIQADNGTTDGVKVTTVASSIYATGTTTVELSASVLTSNLARIFFVSSRDGLTVAQSGQVFATDYGSPGFATLSNAVAAIGVADRMLVMGPGTWAISDNLTIPANITVIPMKGAVFEIADTKALTISGPYQCGPWQCFDDANSDFDGVVFNDGSIKEALPEWFGAIGDDTTDCTAALQGALNSFSTVRISKGTYQILSALTANDGQIVLGSGWDCIIHQAGGTSPAYEHGVWFGDDCQFRNFSIQGTYDDSVTENSAHAFARVVDKAENCVFENLYIKNWTQNGVSGIRSRGSVRHCKFENIWGESVLVQGDYLSITDNLIINNGGWALDSNGNYSVFARNQIYNTGHGTTRWADDCGGIIVTTGGFGAQLKNISIIDNVIHTCGLVGILAADAGGYGLYDLNISNNQLTDVNNNQTSAQRGAICLISSSASDNIDKAIISNNIVNDSYLSPGVSILGGKNIVVSGNQIYDTEYAGIYFGDYSAAAIDNIKIIGNTIKTADANICIYCPGGNNFIVSDNSITAVDGTYQDLIRVDDASHFIISGNNLTGYSTPPTNYRGILLYGTSSYGTISNNRINYAHYGITTGASVTYMIITNNALINCSTPMSLTGGTCTVVQGNSNQPRTGTATPSGAVVPYCVGELYIDTTGNKTYIADGVGNTDWQALN